MSPWGVQGISGGPERGFYGDVIEELDRSVGVFLDTLAKESLEENTPVILTSDNGPWIEEQIGDHGGSRVGRQRVQPL